MNSLFRSCGLVALFACIVASPLPARAIDFSESLLLERYTVLQDNSLQLDTGYLLKSGRFHVFFSQSVPVLFYATIEDFVPISGRPVLDPQAFAAYKYNRIIPKWVRSKDVFQIGYASYVIVAVSGKGDPNPAITILEQPQSVSVLQGHSTILNVDAEPQGYLSYQWSFKGKKLSGETYSSLLILGATPAQAGIYTVALDTGGNVVKSKKALLKVVKPVSIKTGPKSLTVRVGKAVTFRVAVNGTGPFHYQWFWNDTVITNATKSYFSIQKAQLSHVGTYSVSVNNGLSSALSTNAVLTVNP